MEGTGSPSRRTPPPGRRASRAGAPVLLSDADRRYISSRKVTNGSVYSVYVALDGTSILENNDPSLFTDMADEAKRMDAEDARNAADVQEASPPPPSN